MPVHLAGWRTVAHRESQRWPGGRFPHEGGSDEMRILVVGAGAVGGYFGGRLLQAGRDVTFLVRPGRAEQIRKNGFAVRVAAERADELAVRAIVSEQIEAPYDLVLVSCKA